MFDNHLATTYGFIAAILIQNGLTGYCVTAKGLSGKRVINILGPVEKWTCAGIPLLAMTAVKGKSQYGDNKCIIPSSNVDLEGKPFLGLKTRRRQWIFEDHYSNPGPIQFYDFGRNSTNMTLILNHENYNNLLENIEESCERIKSACRFGAHEDLLKAAVYGLDSITKILGIMESKKDF